MSDYSWLAGTGLALSEGEIYWSPINYLLVRGSQTFSVTGQRINILDSVGPVVSDATIQLCHRRYLDK